MTTAAVAVAGLVWMGLNARADETHSVKTYPLTTCVVTGEKLDTMGGPFVFNYQGQEIKLCCKDCLKRFNQNPAGYVKKVVSSASKPAGERGGGCCGPAANI